ncbi:hypothetical protein P9112_008033 [Eukaryota sp. TZLM1-RC]
MSADEPSPSSLAARLRQQARSRKTSATSDLLEKVILSTALIQVGLLFSIEVSIMNSFIRLTLLLAIWAKCCCSGSGLLVAGWVFLIVSHILTAPVIPVDVAFFFLGPFPYQTTVLVSGDFVLCLLSFALLSLRNERPQSSSALSEYMDESGSLISSLT